MLPRATQVADLLVFLPSWPSFVVQGACAAVMLAVLVYIRLDKRHVAVDEVHQPPPQLSTFQPAANVTAVQHVHYTTLDPHTILLSLLALLFVAQMVHFADLVNQAVYNAVTAFLSAGFMVILFMHVLFIGVRGFYFNVRPPQARRSVQSRDADFGPAAAVGQLPSPQLSAMVMVVIYIVLYFTITARTTGQFNQPLVSQFIFYFVFSVALIIVANSTKDIVGRYAPRAAAGPAAVWRRRGPHARRRARQSEVATQRALLDQAEHGEKDGGDRAAAARVAPAPAQHPARVHRAAVRRMGLRPRSKGPRAHLLRAGAGPPRAWVVPG